MMFDSTHAMEQPSPSEILSGLNHFKRLKTEDPETQDLLRSLEKVQEFDQKIDGLLSKKRMEIQENLSYCPQDIGTNLRVYTHGEWLAGKAGIYKVLVISVVGQIVVNEEEGQLLDVEYGHRYKKMDLLRPKNLVDVVREVRVDFLNAKINRSYIDLGKLRSSKKHMSKLMTKRGFKIMKKVPLDTPSPLKIKLSMTLNSYTRVYQLSEKMSQFMGRSRCCKSEITERIWTYCKHKALIKGDSIELDGELKKLFGDHARKLKDEENRKREEQDKMRQRESEFRINLSQIRQQIETQNEEATPEQRQDEEETILQLKLSEINEAVLEHLPSISPIELQFEVFDDRKPPVKNKEGALQVGLEKIPQKLILTRPDGSGGKIRIQSQNPEANKRAADETNQIRNTENNDHMKVSKNEVKLESHEKTQNIDIPTVDEPQINNQDFTKDLITSQNTEIKPPKPDQIIQNKPIHTDNNLMMDKNWSVFDIFVKVQSENIPNALPFFLQRVFPDTKDKDSRVHKDSTNEFKSLVNLSQKINVDDQAIKRLFAYLEKSIYKKNLYHDMKENPAKFMKEHLEEKNKIKKILKKEGSILSKRSSSHQDDQILGILMGSYKGILESEIESYINKNFSER